MLAFVVLDLAFVAINKFDTDLFIDISIILLRFHHRQLVSVVAYGLYFLRFTDLHLGLLVDNLDLLLHKFRIQIVLNG